MKPFVFPEDITAVKDIEAQQTAARERAEAIIALRGDATDEQLEELNQVLDYRDNLTAEGERREQVAADREAKLDAAQARLDGNTDEGGGDEDGDESEDDGESAEGEESAEVDEAPEEADDAAEEGDAAAEVVEQPQAVAAGASKRPRQSVAGKMQTRTNRRPSRQTSDGGSLTIVAAGGNSRGPEGGTRLDIDGMVEAFQARLAGLPGGGASRVPDQRIQQPVAVLSRGDAAFTREVGGKSVVMDAQSAEFAGEKLLDLMDIAASEKNIPGRGGRSGGSLAASGGWCAPSETLYDIPTIEKADGLVSTPEIRVGRGGINFTEGPDFSAIFTGAGFQQTEAEAIAGDSKNCYEVPCATFDEVRLDAIGFCAKSPVLTNSAYPELVKRVLSGILVAHQQKVSRYKLAAIQNLLTVTGTVTDVGEFRRSLLTGLELAAEGQRAGFSMGVDDTMEVILPHWARPALRDDLQGRMRQPDPVSDAQLDAHFTARRLNVQFVYGLNDSAVAVKTAVLQFPATLTALMYPAGTFVTGMTDVLNLDTLYDTTDLQTNVYTAAFFEEGILVAKRLPTGVKLTIPVHPTGRVGMADLDEPFGTANPAGASQAPAA